MTDGVRQIERAAPGRGLLYAAILAGGQGTRLWPRSRQSRPKQFADITGTGRTMLQETVDRLQPEIPLERVFVIGGGEYTALVREQLAGLPTENLIVEPSGRNTAPAIGLALLHLARRDPQAVMVVLPADHVIADSGGFRRALQTAAAIAGQGFVVTLGIKPDRPHTGYGYIQRGERLPSREGLPAYVVRRFLEKPDEATAQQFLEDGGYFWNGGIFIFRLDTMQMEIRRQLPELHKTLSEIDAAHGTSREADTLARVWPQAPKISIDYGVMEHAQQVAVVPIDVGWSDIGDWAALRQVVAGDGNGNIVVSGRHLSIGSRDTVVYGTNDRLIVTVGVEDLIIVDEGDVLLVCPSDQAQNVRLAVEHLAREQQSEYL
jgi:mannose-1-phosphate guanylyltransferase